MIGFLIPLLLILLTLSTPISSADKLPTEQPITWQSMPDDAKSLISRLLPNPNNLAEKHISFEEKLDIITYAMRVKMTCQDAKNLELPYESVDKISFRNRDVHIPQSKYQHIVIALFINDMNAVQNIFKEIVSGSNTTFFNTVFCCAAMSRTATFIARSLSNQNTRMNLYRKLINATQETFKQNNYSYEGLKDGIAYPITLPLRIQKKYEQDSQNIIDVRVQITLLIEKPYDTILTAEECEALSDFMRKKHLRLNNANPSYT